MYIFKKIYKRLSNSVNFVGNQEHYQNKNVNGDLVNANDNLVNLSEIVYQMYKNSNEGTINIKHCKSMLACFKMLISHTSKLTDEYEYQRRLCSPARSEGTYHQLNPGIPTLIEITEDWLSKQTDVSLTIGKNLSHNLKHCIELQHFDKQLLALTPKIELTLRHIIDNGIKQPN